MPGERRRVRMSGRGKEPAQCSLPCPLRASGVPHLLLGAFGCDRVHQPGRCPVMGMLWGPEPLQHRVRFAAGFAEDALGFSSLFPSWELSLPIVPKAEVPSPAGLVDQEDLQQPGLAFGSSHPRRARRAAVPAAATSRTARGSHGWAVELLPTKSLMSTGGETVPWGQRNVPMDHTGAGNGNQPRPDTESVAQREQGVEKTHGVEAGSRFCMSGKPCLELLQSQSQPRLQPLD